MTFAFLLIAGAAAAVGAFFASAGAAAVVLVVAEGAGIGEVGAHGGVLVPPHGRVKTHAFSFTQISTVPMPVEGSKSGP